MNILTTENFPLFGTCMYTLDSSHDIRSWDIQLLANLSDDTRVYLSCANLPEMREQLFRHILLEPLMFHYTLYSNPLHWVDLQ